MNQNVTGGGVIVSTIISMAWISLVVWVNMVKGQQLPLVFYAGLLPCWLMFFVTGVALGLRPNREYCIIIPLIITLVGVVLSVYESIYLYGHFATGVGIKSTAFIYSFGAILLLFSAKVEAIITKTSIIFKALVFVGELSFGVYLTHCYTLLFVSRLHLDFWFLRFILTLGITIVFIVLLRRLLPTKCHKYIGI